MVIPNYIPYRTVPVFFTAGKLFEFIIPAALRVIAVMRPVCQFDGFPGF
jgi:hypothetical protein